MYLRIYQRACRGERLRREATCDSLFAKNLTLARSRTWDDRRVCGCKALCVHDRYATGMLQQARADAVSSGCSNCECIVTNSTSGRELVSKEIVTRGRAARSRWYYMVHLGAGECNY